MKHSLYPRIVTKNYLFDLSERENKVLYYKMKNKYGYSLDKKEYEWLERTILDKLSTYQEQHFVISETSNTFFLDTLGKSGRQITTIYKRSIPELIPYLDQQNMMRQERIKLYALLDKMSHLQVSLLPANQRARFKDILFKKPDSIPTDFMCVDDSNFTGITAAALRSVLPEHQNDFFVFNFS